MTESTAMSDSFVERENKEREKLRLSISTQLQHDLHSIFEREEHYDLTFVYKKIRWNVHTALLQQRAPIFYSHVKDCGDEVSMAFLAEEECDTFGNWLRALYTENSVDKYEATVNEWISKLKKSIEDGTQQTNENVNMEELNHQQEMVIDTTGKNVNSLSAEEGVTDLPECCSQLGNELISTLISGKGTDLELRVHDGMVRVHKFIVSGRTHYFAAMLSGAWRESSNSCIYLPNFSLSALLSTLYFIYGGVLNIPRTASICEVLFIADMYNLQGLKDVVMLRLKRDNCHFFHKPCTDCLARAPEALALSVQFHETNFTKVCLRWMTKHFERMWRSKSFAAMGKQLMHMCYESALEELKPDSVVALVTQSDKLLETLPRVKWNNPLIELVEKLRDAGLVYIAQNFRIVSRRENFQALLKGMGWSCNLLELMFNKVVAALVPETANSVFLCAVYLKKMAEDDELSNSVSTELVKFYYKCYTYMVNNASHQILIDNWNYLPEDLKIKIKKDAVYVDEGKKTLVPKPKLTSASRPKAKPLQVEKPAPTSASAKPAGARPKIKTTQAKPTELTSKSSVKAKTSERASSPAPTATTSNRSQSIKTQSTKPKESSTKFREASVKSKDVSSKSRENSAKSITASVKSTDFSAKSKQASTKLETSVKSKVASKKSTEAPAKSAKEVVAKPNKPSTNSREPTKPEKVRRQPKSAGVLKNKQSIKDKKVDSAVLIGSSASPLNKPLIDKKGAVKPSPIKQMPSKSSASVKSLSTSTKGSSTSRVQKTSRPPHCKPSSNEKLPFGKSKSKDVTDTKFKTTRKQADSAKITVKSETQLEPMVRSKVVTSPTYEVSAAAESLDTEASVASVTEKKNDEETIDNAKKGNASELDIPKSSDITESCDSIIQMSSNSADNDNFKVIEEIESMPSLPNVDKVTFRTSDNSIVEDAEKLVLSKAFICDTLDEALSNAATEEECDDNKDIDNNLQISSQSTEEQSHSSSQLPSETALKCDDMCDQKSNNTEASDIEMDDIDFIPSDGTQFGVEDEGTYSEELQKLAHDESNSKESLKDNIKICESSEDSLVDLDVNADIISDAREGIVNEYPEEIGAVICDDNVSHVVECQEKDEDLPEQVLDETEDFSDAADVENLIKKSEVVKNQGTDDAIVEQVTGQIEVDVNDSVVVDDESFELSPSNNAPSTDKSIQIERSHELIANDIVKDTTDISLFHKQDDVEDHVSSHVEVIDDSEEIAEHTSSDIESTLSVSDCDRNIGNENTPHEQMFGTDDVIPLENDKEANEEERGEDIQYGEQNEESDEIKEENYLQLGSDKVNDDAEADENIESDDYVSGSTNPVTNGIHSIDSSKGESHAEEEHEEAAEYSERFILSKALRHGTTNGASSVTVSQQVE